MSHFSSFPITFRSLLPYSKTPCLALVQRKTINPVLFGCGVIFQCIPSFTGQCGGHFLDRVLKGIQQRFQLLHQSQRRFPLDFIAAKMPPQGYEIAARILNGHCLAQAEALMCGRDENDLQHLPPEQSYPRTCVGNRPSTTLIIDALVP